MKNNQAIIFLKEQLLEMSMGGAFQHNKIYKEKVTQAEKIEFRKYLSQLIKESAKRINNLRHKDDKVIYEEIENISNDVSGFPCVKDFTIGTSQKILNLYLKYLWVAGLGSEPPHCPVDSKILAACKSDKKWTKIDKIDDYKNIIESVQSIKGNKTIAQWELEEWNKYKQYDRQ